MRRSTQQGQGFTLIELMIALAITSIIVVASFTVLTTSNKATRANDQVAGMQYNARAAMELMSRDIKMAGFGMVGPVGNCNTPIVPLDNNPGGADTGPDAVSVATQAVSYTTTQWVLAAQAAGPFSQISLPSSQVGDMVTQGLANGSMISLGGVVSAQVATVAAAAGTITLQTPVGSSAVFPANTPVYLLQCVTYQVIPVPDANNVCGGTAPCLVRGVVAGLNCNVATSPCVPIVDGIEDLQLAYACDGCVATINAGIPDGVIDDQNVNGTFDQADFITNSNWTTTPLTADTIRLVQISLVARQISAEQGLGETQSAGINTPTPLVVSDHNQAQDASYIANPTQYAQQRRRVLVRTVETRNMGL
jgi:type IV pilus assembly protein PilW